LWLLDLIVGIAFAVVSLLLLTLGASPLLLLFGDESLKVLGIVLTIGLELLIILMLVVAGVIISILGQFWSREISIADRGIGQALASGYELFRARAQDVGVMWLLLIGIGLGFGIVMIPVALLVIALAVASGVGVGYGMYAVTQSIGWAVAVGLPPFLLIVIVPLTLIQAVYLVFESSAWTLTYREVAKGQA
jgi:hypothetical protein